MAVSLAASKFKVSRLKKAVGREPPFRQDLSPEAEEYSLLEAVTRQLLVKILQAGKKLACALVIC
jgi:hypothetical protein